ncbi:disease resistance TIR-NBS-LRR class family protein [Tanacetum coccineum]
MSSSSSSIPKSFKYDVFLSFRGEDTRKNFVGHLYKALKAKCIETYKDDEKIQKGERISDELIKAIQESRFFIIVFSKTYASSSWCLDELVKIMECQNTAEQTAYPVFFDVEPTQVRKQNGPVGEAFSKHENHEATGKWRDAMKELADLAGWELKATANGDESKSIQIIVDAIFRKLHSTHSIANEKLVGMETRISNVLSSLEISAEDVRMIGIKGIGGGGKTTLARAVYDRISNHFEGKSFVENVREVSKPTLSGLWKLQKRILQDVLNKTDINISSVHDGRDMLIATMRRRKILVVLDDVDCMQQLEALAGESTWFKLGSRIIITTRDEQVLLAHGVNFVHDVNLLSSTEAICLFNRYAFPKEIPIRGYEELSGQVVRYAAGLPLTVKVLGSFLYGKDMVEWKDAIDRLKRIPLKDTLEMLELSYKSLEKDYKEMFLDIACILKGESRKDAIRILESCGFHARNGLKVLEQRSLITISCKYGEYGELVLGMHDHIEEMGKHIVRRKHPNEPNKHSHLWIQDEIEDILANDMGTGKTRCIKIDGVFGSQDTKKTRILGKRKKLMNGVFEKMNGLGKMKNLRYLELNFYHFKRDVECLDDTSLYFPNSLKYLKCTHYPFLYLPKTFQANNLVGLEMKDTERPMVLNKLKFVSLSRTSLKFKWFSEDYSLNDVPNGSYIPRPKLNYIDISHSELRAFDLGLTPNIETLSLRYSPNLGELCMPVSCEKLKHLVISESKLRTFSLGLTPNLQTLSLFDCADFVELHASVACPNLKFLDICGSSLRSLDLELIPNLERLVLENCNELAEINAPVGCLKKVGYLKLNCLRYIDFEFGGGCEPKVGRPSASLDLLPEDLGRLECLEKLHVSSKKIEYLPDSICMLKRLKWLYVTGCRHLGKLHEDIGQLESLERLVLTDTAIKHLPDSVCMLKHLKYLNLDGCALLEKSTYYCISELLQLYDFPSEIPTTDCYRPWSKRKPALLDRETLMWLSGMSEEAYIRVQRDAERD